MVADIPITDIPITEMPITESNAIGSINVEVAYAMPEKQIIRAVNVDVGTTAGAAIVQSGIMMDFPELELEKAKIGVFGKATAMTTVLNEGDRVEIYRPLIADPKEVRRQRAAEGKKMKKGEEKNKSENG